MKKIQTGIDLKRCTPQRLMQQLEPVHGLSLPTDLASAVRLLRTPTIVLTHAQYDTLLKRAQKERCDVYAFRGGWVTFGYNSGQWVLWPLAAKPPSGLG